ncbi:hypothetical protein Cgig2_006334 [Carnegiea gigantea]|uniref:Uncharacterized protein n=1 Tax=Carnegiea gigantea TaxID=171969 RepID=A0A9Q1GIZ2_9CARY|nr:hypothetical protein Cgig2_006334 [Carnegiea gigantea]
MKVTNEIVQRILIDTRSSVDIITLDCPKKLAYPGRDIVPLVHPILEVNPTGVIRLLARFEDKGRAKNVEVDFLVVDNIILGRPTLHKIKVVIAPDLLQLQFEANDGSVGTMQGDQHTAGECYLVSIRPLMERTNEKGPGSPQPDQPRPEATKSVEQVQLEGHLDRTRGSSLNLKVILLIRERDELHHFRVPTFHLSPLTLLDIVAVSLKELYAFFTALPVALLLGLVRLLGLRCGFGLSLCKSSLALESASLNLPCRSVFSAFQVSLSSLSFSQRSLYLAAVSSNLRRSDIENGKLEKEEKEVYVPPTSVTTTSSLVTLGGSEVPEATSPMTWPGLKLVPTWQLNQLPRSVSPTDGETACATLRVPRTPWGPGPLSIRSTTLEKSEGRVLYLLSCHIHKASPIFLRTTLGLGRYMLRGGISTLEGRQLRPCLLYTKLKKVRPEPDGKADQGRDVEPIPRLPISIFALPFLGPLRRLCHLNHKLWNRPQMVILPYIIEKVASHPPLLVGRAKGIPDWLLFIPTTKVPPA